MATKLIAFLRGLTTGGNNGKNIINLEIQYLMGLNFGVG